MPTQYRIIPIPEEHKLLAQILLPGTDTWQDFVHPRRAGARYHDSVEHMVHRDVHEIYPDAEQQGGHSTMETFEQKLASLLTPEQIDVVVVLIDINIIGGYEAMPIPEFRSPEDVARFAEQDNDIAVRNALKREQRRKLQEK